MKIFDISVIKRADIIGNRLEIFLRAILNSFFQKYTVVIQYLLDEQFLEKQPSRSVRRKMCSEYMLEIYKRAPMPKCNFNKVALQVFWIRFSAWVFSSKFAANFQNTFSQEHLWKAASESSPVKLFISITVQAGNNFQVLFLQTFSWEGKRMSKFIINFLYYFVWNN